MRRETIDHPTHSAAIQDECAACHMPMAHADRARRRRQGRGVRAPADRRPTTRRSHRLAADGISCTVCHQISSERLGTRESFNGDFVAAADAGRRRARHLRAVPDRRRAQDDHALGHRLRAGGRRRTSGSRSCAPSCHTLITQAFGPDGEVDRLAARADELSGVAAQRLQPGGAKLPVVPHAGGAGADPHVVGARRRARHAGAARCSSAATPSWCGC